MIGTGAGIFPAPEREPNGSPFFLPPNSESIVSPPRATDFFETLQVTTYRIYAIPINRLASRSCSNSDFPMACIGVRTRAILIF